MEGHIATRYFSQLCQWHDKWKPREIHKKQWCSAIKRLTEAQAQHALDLYYKTREAKYESPSLGKFWEMIHQITKGQLSMKDRALAEFWMLCTDLDGDGGGRMGMLYPFTYYLDQKLTIDWDKTLSKLRFGLYEQYGGVWNMYHDMRKAHHMMREIMDTYGWPPIPGTVERRFLTLGRNVSVKEDAERIGPVVEQVAKGVEGTPVEESGFGPEVGSEDAATDFDPNRLMKDDDIPY